MPRAGAEAKPHWRSLPRELRDATEAKLGTRVRRADRVWGGYAPSATFRLHLADGRTVFFKGASALDPNPVLHRSLSRELPVYRRLHELIAPWAPAYYGDVSHQDWLALLLEDVGPATVPPWTEARTRSAALAYGEFHAATYGRPLPGWLPRRREWAPFGQDWQRLLEQAHRLDAVAALAGPRTPEARAWLTTHAGTLNDVALAFLRTRGPFSLLHFDTRSDNLRIRGSRLTLFDWPYACAGPPEFDAAAFAQSVTCEGGPSPERFMGWYAGRQPVRERVLTAAVAAIAGFFANQARGAEIPGLPRLRSIQRRQLKASLPWAARRLSLPDPEWTSSVPD